MERRIIHDKDNQSIIQVNELEVDLDIGGMTRESFDHLDPLWIVHHDFRPCGLAHRIGVKADVGRYEGRPVDWHFHFYRALGRDLSDRVLKVIDDKMAELATYYTRMLIVDNPLVVVQSILCSTIPEFLAKELDEGLDLLKREGYY